MKPDILRIDFETRSPVDIKLGVELYSKHPDCDVITVSYRLPGREKISRWNRGWNMQQAPTPLMVNDQTALHDHVRNGGLVGGWNVMFEWHIWNNVCVPKYGWPPLPLEQCVDTMAQAQAMNIPAALGKAAAVMGTPEQKEKRGKYLINRLCKWHKATKLQPARWVEDEALFNEFCDYCDQDVLTEEALAKKLRALSAFEQTIWIITQRINLRGIPINVPAIEGIIQVVEGEKARMNAELRQITNRQVLKATDRNGLLAWCNARAKDIHFDEEADEPELVDLPDFMEDVEGAVAEAINPAAPMLPNLKGKTVDALLERTDLPADVRRVLEIRRSVCQTSTAKFPKMLKIVAADGTVKNMFVYHGAGPGRWASRGGLNSQNYPRPTIPKKEIAVALDILSRGDHALAYTFFGEETMDAAVSSLRSVISAPQGYEFVDADFSSVENRVGVWLAGQQDKLDMFAQGLDEYRVFASTALYGVPYEQVDDAMRQMSKSAVLGCLFGQGPKGLVEYAKGFGVILTLERAQEIVKLYRAEYSSVKHLWYACARAALDAVKNPGSWYKAGDKLELICHNSFLWMRLPSGRLISWCRPRIESQCMPWTKTQQVQQEDGTTVEMEMAVFADVITVESVHVRTRQWTRFTLIGSSLFQSSVQGTAADLLRTAMVNAEAGGFELCLIAHDEAMALALEGTKDPDELGRLMCKNPDWALDLPLAYEAWRNPYFRK